MEKAFQDQKIFIGIDVHKKSWAVSIIGEHNSFKTFTQPPSPSKLYKYLSKNFPGARYYAVYEAGFCGFTPCKELNKLGVKCIVVNPAGVPTKDKEKRQKTDSADSRKLLRSLRATELEPIYIPSDDLLKARSLLRYRNKLVGDQTRCKNRIKSFMFFNGIPIPEVYDNSIWSNQFINWLKSLTKEHPTLHLLIEQLTMTKAIVKQVNKSIMLLSKTDAYKSKVELLKSIPGIGALTAISLILEIGDINRFSSLDKLCCFVGLIPNTSSSGEKEYVGNITSRGNNNIKKYIIESSWTTIKRDPEMMAAFGKLCQRMTKNRAIIRIAKKLLGRIKAVLISEQPYQINYNL